MVYILISNNPSGTKRFHGDYRGNCRFTARADAELQCKRDLPRYPTAEVMIFETMRDANLWVNAYNEKVLADLDAYHART